MRNTYGTLLLLLNHLELGETQDPMSSSSSSSVIYKKIYSLMIISVPNQCCCPWEQTWDSNSPLRLQQAQTHKKKKKKSFTLRNQNKRNEEREGEKERKSVCVRERERERERENKSSDYYQCCNCSWMYDNIHDEQTSSSSMKTPN